MSESDSEQKLEIWDVKWYEKQCRAVDTKMSVQAAQVMDFLVKLIGIGGVVTGL